MLKKISVVIGLMCTGMMLSAQSGYSNYADQHARIHALVKAWPHLIKVSSIATTAGGKNIWMMSIGAGNTRSRPAIAIIGGVEGNHLLGTELAIGFAEKLLRASNTDSIKNLLSRTTFYIFPNMSPDAMEQYFAPLQYERQGNASKTDDDRDGQFNEDGYDDLDRNGKITWMRIESPIGDYRMNPECPQSMIKADVSKGEKGNYLLMPEGIDNDKDGKFDEDGEGGVWFNKNLSFNYPYFTQGAGEFAVSENESRALLDTLFELFNVYAVISFSSQNNLSAPFSFNSGAASSRVITGWKEPDIKVNNMVSDLYNKTVTIMKEAPKPNHSASGDLLSWGYYHYGRFSFSTPGWFVPKKMADTAKKEKPFTIDDPVANYLRWSANENGKQHFTEWKKTTHPDFPGQQVEVGGIDPFVLINPPYQMVDEITCQHVDFIIKFSALQPETDIVQVKTEKLDNNITRITASVINKGFFPSHTKIGEQTYWLKSIRVKLSMVPQQSMISGKKIQTLGSQAGYQSNELSWLIKGSGKIILEAGSPTTGIKQISITL